MPQQESMDFDIAIVGAGPAGLAAAIRLAQLDKDLKICVLEKGATFGAQNLAGAVLEPRALDELLPDWRHLNAPVTCQVTQDQFGFLTAKKYWRLPLPSPLNNHGNYIISIDQFCRWLGEQAEKLGISIFPGFAGSALRYDDSGKVTGVITGDFGVGKDGQPTARFQPGVEIIAKQTLLAEGAHGSLTKEAIAKFNLRDGKNPQTYGLGIKELWEVDPKVHQQGLVMHTVGWPLDHKTYGGSFLYHWDQNRISVGLVVGLDYENPYMDPFAEMQRFKTHPAIKKIFENGKRIGYGARALVEGGLQSLPKLTFPGGMLIGDTAGFLNVPKIKGIHTAMKSGMLAAESIVHGISKNAFLCDTHGCKNLEKPLPINNNEVNAYPENFKNSWLYQELSKVRNIRPGFHHGLIPGLAYAAIDNYLLRGKAPWTFKNHADYLQLKPAAECKKIEYPKTDGKITFDKLSSLYLCNIKYDENQPCHLQLKNPALAIEVNFKIYASPETHYCPANVYEIVTFDKNPKLQINAANCIHCKTCDIKDPRQNINWTTPEGGSGPNYIDL